MAATEHPMQALVAYLPEGTFDQVVDYLHKHKVHLTLTKERKSVLGDYRNAIPGKNHRISVNHNLNKYAFLITLLHELAHLLTFEKYGHRVMSHGREWKQLYSSLLATFVEHKVFPEDITGALRKSLTDPAASSCAEEGLMRILRKYDTKKEHLQLLDELPPGSTFKTPDGRVFKKGERLRKRYRCMEVNTGLVYLFSPIYEVELAEAGTAADGGAVLKPEEGITLSIKDNERLTHTIKNNNPKREHLHRLENLPLNTLFKIPDGRIFQKGEKLRKRYRCREVKTGAVYLFSPVYEVLIVAAN